MSIQVNFDQPDGTGYDELNYTYAPNGKNLLGSDDSLQNVV